MLCQSLGVLAPEYAKSDLSAESRGRTRVIKQVDRWSREVNSLEPIPVVGRNGSDWGRLTYNESNQSKQLRHIAFFGSVAASGGELGIILPGHFPGFAN